MEFGDTRPDDNLGRRAWDPSPQSPGGVQAHLVSVRKNQTKRIRQYGFSTLADRGGSGLLQSAFITSASLQSSLATRSSLEKGEQGPFVQNHKKGAENA